jgi:mRNA interferase HigB
MRLIARATLREFWESSPAYTDAKTPLIEWYRHMAKSTFHRPQDLKA